ncbi:MAG: putative sulfate/molybdate transporter [Burkholderiaceae bacterium]
MALAALFVRTFRGNRYDRAEFAGAFGDLGTLLPFLTAYIALLKIDPFGLLLSFGLAKICAGLVFKTPFPVQPMKAIGAIATTQAAQTAVITPQIVTGAGLVTGLVWFLLGATGAVRSVASLIGRPVALGIILGLGFSFMLDGIRMMSSAWWLAAGALGLTLALLRNRRVPAMFLLLLLGAAVALLTTPGLVQELLQLRIAPRLPSPPVADMRWTDLLQGALLLALPQLPLTLGNAIISITEENNRLFPAHPVTERQVALSTGLMNLLAPLLGGVPMCHGAGGMAGHVAFGARTGGSLVILGSILVAVAVFFSGSVDTLLRMFPPAVLGVILFVTGAQLALGTGDASRLDRNARFVMLATAAFSVWNIGIAFVFGVVAHRLFEKGVFRL